LWCSPGPQPDANNNVPASCCTSEGTFTRWARQFHLVRMAVHWTVA
jgi:hypothetical protein